MNRPVDRSVDRVGTPSGSTEQGDRSYVRTYVRTNEEPWSPSGDNSPSVTRTRTYGIPTRPPTPDELDALYAALGTTRAASNLRREQRDKQPKKTRRRA